MTTVTAYEMNILLATRSGAQAIEAASHAVACVQTGNLRDTRHLVDQAAHCLTIMRAAAYKASTGTDPALPAEVTVPIDVLTDLLDAAVPSAAQQRSVDRVRDLISDSRYADPAVAAEISRDVLIHDLSVVLAGALHRSSMAPLEPFVAAQRLQEVLGLPDDARPSQVRAVLHPLLTGDRAEAGEEPG